MIQHVCKPFWGDKSTNTIDFKFPAKNKHPGHPPLNFYLLLNWTQCFVRNTNIGMVERRTENPSYELRIKQLALFCWQNTKIPPMPESWLPSSRHTRNGGRGFFSGVRKSFEPIWSRYAVTHQILQLFLMWSIQKLIDNPGRSSQHCSETFFERH